MKGHRVFPKSLSISILLNLTFLLGLCLSAAASERIRFAPTGDFTIDEHVRGGIRHYDDTWRSHSQNKKTVTVTRGSAAGLQGAFKTRSAELFELNQTMKRVSADEIDYQAEVTHAKGVATNLLCVELILPARFFVGKTFRADQDSFAFPADFGKVNLLKTRSVKCLLLQTREGWLEITGDLRVMVNDRRKWNEDAYGIRLMFLQSKGIVKQSAIAFKLRTKRYDTIPFDISAAANMGFRDETANDRRGGWTDQGPENDLRMLKPGTRRFGGIPFTILDPATNQGKSCIVMAGPSRDYFPKSVAIPGGNARCKYLYFLHAAAWAASDAAYGIVRVQYTDGSEERFEVKGRRDVGDWWACAPLPNGAVVWTGENKRSYVGLFMSRFEIADKAIRKLELTSTGKAVWGVAAISGCTDDVPLPSKMGESYIVAGKDWQPFNYTLDVEPGSALDMSFLNDALAGKDGPIIIQDGHFRFENAPRKPVRFYGVNLNLSANYLSKPECETLAERLAAYGYNAVRFHHHDKLLVDTAAGDSLTILPERMDKLDYLFHCLKRRGIYSTTDLFVSRKIKPAEVDALKHGHRYIKAMAPLSAQAMDNLKAFSRKFLNHVNPYTGLAWKDDPALVSLSFINENCLPHIWYRHPHDKALYEEAFEEWKAKRQPNSPAATNRNADFNVFLSAMQIRSFEQMKAYVGGELNCRKPFSDCNHVPWMGLAMARDRYDYVDNHAYWDHPKFPVRAWSNPVRHHNRSVLADYCQVPCKVMPTRIFGKPFTMTEFDYVWPNPHRSEGSAVMGALAALQDWDAVYRFAFAYSRENATTVAPARRFDVSTDPAKLLGERIVALLYRRGDVLPARKSVPFVIAPERVGDNLTEYFPLDYSRLGLVHRIGSVVERDGLALPADAAFAVAEPATSKTMIGRVPVYSAASNLLERLTREGRMAKSNVDSETGKTLSDTGQVALDAKAKTFAVVTERSECLVLPARLAGGGKVLTVTDNTSFATYFAAGLDGKPLADSDRILVLHLTDIQNTKTKFLNTDHTLVARDGTLPHLVRKGRARIALKRRDRRNPTLWAVNASGKRLRKLPVETTAEGCSFTVDTLGSAGACMAYEIAFRKLN
jgi:hypothetical protein